MPGVDAVAARRLRDRRSRRHGGGAVAGGPGQRVRARSGSPGPPAARSPASELLRAHPYRTAAWSGWDALATRGRARPHPGHAPRPAGARPGTDPMIVGDVDDVQVKATSPSAQHAHRTG